MRRFLRRILGIEKIEQTMKMMEIKIIDLCEEKERRRIRDVQIGIKLDCLTRISEEYMRKKGTKKGGKRTKGTRC